MPLHVVETQRLYRQIAEQIRALVAAGEFARGTRLPSERDIAKQLRVSRTSVREALIALEIEGLIEVRGGSGIYVNPAKDGAGQLFGSGDADPGPFELLRARRVIEGEIAALAAGLIDDDGLHALERTVEAYKSHAHHVDSREDADRDFHLCIAEFANNSVLLQTVRLYMDQRRGPMWRRIVEHFQSPALLNGVISDHRAVIAALRSRDPAAARAAMHRHLDRVEKEFTKGWEKAMPDVAMIAAAARPRRREQRHRARAAS